MADVDGASPKEQILEACRRDNVDLFNEVLTSVSKDTSKEKVADFFNNVTDTMGNYLLHVCASYGSCTSTKSSFRSFPPRLNIPLTDLFPTDDVMDELLNIEFLECDPLTRRDRETPIHSAVKYANEREVELGTAIANMLIDAGGDPRVKDSHGRKPAEICTPRTEELKKVLREAEYVMNEGLKVQQEQEDDGPTGSASDSE